MVKNASYKIRQNVANVWNGKSMHFLIQIVGYVFQEIMVKNGRDTNQQGHIDILTIENIVNITAMAGEFIG